MGLTDAQIAIKLNKNEKDIAGIQRTLGIMQDDINSRLHLSELSTMKLELEETIRDNAELIVDLQARLGKVMLPDDTRYYLEEGEVEAFKSNFSKLRAMLARFETLYNSIVAYVAQLRN